MDTENNRKVIVNENKIVWIDFVIIIIIIMLSQKLQIN